MGCYATVSDRPCRANKYLSRCLKCNTITCAAHMRAHAISCGSFTEISDGNPNQDQITELRAQLARQQELIEKLLSSTAAVETSFIEPKRYECEQEQAIIMADTTTSCFNKLGLINQLAEDFGPTFQATPEVEAFGAEHTIVRGDKFKFFAPDSCTACRRKALNN